MGSELRISDKEIVLVYESARFRLGAMDLRQYCVRLVRAALSR